MPPGGGCPHTWLKPKSWQCGWPARGASPPLTALGLLAPESTNGPPVIKPYPLVPTQPGGRGSLLAHRLYLDAVTDVERAEAMIEGLLSAMRNRSITTVAAWQPAYNRALLQVARASEKSEFIPAGAKCGWCTRVTKLDRNGPGCVATCGSTLDCALNCRWGQGGGEDDSMILRCRARLHVWLALRGKTTATSLWPSRHPHKPLPTPCRATPYSGTIKSCIPKGFTYASAVDWEKGTVSPEVRQNTCMSKVYPGWEGSLSPSSPQPTTRVHAGRILSLCQSIQHGYAHAMAQRTSHVP